MCGSWVSLCKHLGKLEHAAGPCLAFLLDPLALLGLVADEPFNATASSHDFKTEVLESGIGFLLVVVLCNEKALCRLRKITPEGPCS